MYLINVIMKCIATVQKKSNYCESMCFTLTMQRNYDCEFIRNFFAQSSKPICIDANTHDEQSANCLSHLFLSVFYLTSSNFVTPELVRFWFQI